MSNTYTYETHFEPYVKRFKEIIVPDEKVDRINNLVGNVVKAKASEQHHKVDGNQENKRFYTGFLGEAAVEVLLGRDVIDWSVGNSRIYNVPDINIDGKKVGVKTVEHGKFPVIFVKNSYPQIICVKTDINRVLICGLASQEILNKYQSSSLIIDPRLRNRGVKTGFYGFEYLKQFWQV